jgi:hypothetical protein
MKGVRNSDLRADIAVIGGGTGGFSAAIAAARNGSKVVLTEQTDWVGGQFTSQAVPPDEHPWIEEFGCTRSYRQFRNGIREYYKSHYPLSDAARKTAWFNPGNAMVSNLSFEPRIGLSVLESMAAPFVSSGRLRILLNHKPIHAHTNGDFVEMVRLVNTVEGLNVDVKADYYIDATELGDLLPLTGTEYVTGAESCKDTGEPHAPTVAQPDNIQAMTSCFAIEYCPNQIHTIEPPEEYAFWRNHVPRVSPPWPGKLLDWTYSHPIDLSPRALPFDPPNAPSPAVRSEADLWTYRRIRDHRNFQKGFCEGDVTLVNWPQNDYFLGHLIDVSEEEADHHIFRSRQLSLSLLHWLQTEAPHPDGRTGWPELRIRGDLTGTSHGLAKYPYIRESRRIRAQFTVLEQHISNQNPQTGCPGTGLCEPVTFHHSVGIGCYRLDLHPSTGGNNYVDLPSLPFEIPLGILIPRRVRNLLAGAKNAGVTHITNGCFRLHPVEWNIGEVSGLLAHYCIRHNRLPEQIHCRQQDFDGFQKFVVNDGVNVHWPELHPV